MTNDDLITVQTFIDANAPSIVKDAFDIICKELAEALKPSHNSDYAADLASKLSHIVRDRTGCDYELRRTLYEDFCKVLNASTHFA